MAILKYGMEWYVGQKMSDIPVRTDRTVRHRCCHLGLNVETSIHSERFTECLVRPRLVVWREGYGLASLITLSTTFEMLISGYFISTVCPKELDSTTLSHVWSLAQQQNFYTF